MNNEYSTRLELNTNLSILSMSIFSRNREKESIYIYDYLRDYINTHAESDLINCQNKINGIESLIRIFSTAAFIKWKNIEDFSKDAIKIAQDLIIPINNIVETIGVATHYKGRKGKLKKIIYFPQLHPLQTNFASSMGARGIVETFIKYKKDNNIDLNLYTFAFNPSIKEKFRKLSFYSHTLECDIDIYEYRGHEYLKDVISHINPDGIIYDYFVYPWTFLPYIYRNIKFLYLSFGFIPCIFSHTKSIISYKSEYYKMKTFISEFSQAHTPGFRAIGRAELSFPNLEIDLDEGNSSKILFDNLRKNYKHIAVSLCRATKISKSFLILLKGLLANNPELFIILAGKGMTKINLDENIAQRILLTELVPPRSLLSIADLYLETFPEHQGHSIIEAMQFNIPIIYLNGIDCNHILLEERSKLGLCYSINEAINLASKIFIDSDYKAKLLSDQKHILGNIYDSPNDVWHSIIESFNVYDENI